QIELGEEDWRLLSERLAGRQFDLAVDLRKHPETRPVLRHTGARYLAGFDHRNLFGWLDIALEWGGDEALARKRQHTSDDLVNLVDAIAAACEDDRRAARAGDGMLAVSRQQQRAAPHRRRARGADGRGSFRLGRCPRMGPDRSGGGGRGARGGMFPLLSRGGKGLPPRPRLPARADPRCRL